MEPINFDDIMREVDAQIAGQQGVSDPFAQESSTFSTPSPSPDGIDMAQIMAEVDQMFADPQGSSSMDSSPGFTMEGADGYTEAPFTFTTPTPEYTPDPNPPTPFTSPFTTEVRGLETAPRPEDVYTSGKNMVSLKEPEQIRQEKLDQNKTALERAGYETAAQVTDPAERQRILHQLKIDQAKLEQESAKMRNEDFMLTPMGDAAALALANLAKVNIPIQALINTAATPFDLMGSVVDFLTSKEDKNKLHRMADTIRQWTPYSQWLNWGNAEIKKQVEDKLKKGEYGDALWTGLYSGASNVAISLATMIAGMKVAGGILAKAKSPQLQAIGKALYGSKLYGTGAETAKAVNAGTKVLKGFENAGEIVQGGLRMAAWNFFTSQENDLGQRVVDSFKSFWFGMTPLLGPQFMRTPAMAQALEIVNNSILSAFNGSYSAAWKEAQGLAQQAGDDPNDPKSVAKYLPMTTAAETLLSDVVGTLQTRNTWRQMTMQRYENALKLTPEQVTQMRTEAANVPGATVDNYISALKKYKAPAEPSPTQRDVEQSNRARAVTYAAKRPDIAKWVLLDPSLVQATMKDITAAELQGIRDQYDAAKTQAEQDGVDVLALEREMMAKGDVQKVVSDAIAQNKADVVKLAQDALDTYLASNPKSKPLVDNPKSRTEALKQVWKDLYDETGVDPIMEQKDFVKLLTEKTPVEAKAPVDPWERIAKMVDTKELPVSLTAEQVQDAVRKAEATATLWQDKVGSYTGTYAESNNRRAQTIADNMRSLAEKATTRGLSASDVAKIESMYKRTPQAKTERQAARKASQEANKVAKGTRSVREQKPSTVESAEVGGLTYKVGDELTSFGKDGVESRVKIVAIRPKGNGNTFDVQYIDAAGKPMDQVQPYGEGRLKSFRPMEWRKQLVLDINNAIQDLQNTDVRRISVNDLVDRLNSGRAEPYGVQMIRNVLRAMERNNRGELNLTFRKGAIDIPIRSVSGSRRVEPVVPSGTSEADKVTPTQAQGAKDVQAERLARMEEIQAKLENLGRARQTDQTRSEMDRLVREWETLQSKTGTIPAERTPIAKPVVEPKGKTNAEAIRSTQEKIGQEQGGSDLRLGRKDQAGAEPTGKAVATEVNAGAEVKVEPTAEGDTRAQTERPDTVRVEGTLQDVEKQIRSIVRNAGAIPVGTLNRGMYAIFGGKESPVRVNFITDVKPGVRGSRTVVKYDGDRISEITVGYNPETGDMTTIPHELIQHVSWLALSQSEKRVLSKALKMENVPDVMLDEAMARRVEDAVVRGEAIGEPRSFLRKAWDNFVSHIRSIAGFFNKDIVGGKAYRIEQAIKAGEYLNKPLYGPKGTTYSSEHMRKMDEEYFNAIYRGDLETAKRLVDEAASNAKLETLANDEDAVAFKYMREKPPKKTIKAYAVFNVSNGMRAAYAGTENVLPVGVWLNAQAMRPIQSETKKMPDGSPVTYIPGDTGMSGKEAGIDPKKYGLPASQKFLFFRPGKHAADVPNFKQMQVKDEVTGENHGAMPHDKLVFEIDVGADVDLTKQMLNEAPVNKSTGNIIYRQSGLQRIPKENGKEGFYYYKTNPNANGNWIISSSFKINRLVPYSEIIKKNLEAGLPIPKWNGGYKPEDFGLSESKISEIANNPPKLTDVITRDDNGNIIPLSQRFNSGISDIRYQMSQSPSVVVPDRDPSITADSLKDDPAKLRAYVHQFKTDLKLKSLPKGWEDMFKDYMRFGGHEGWQAKERVVATIKNDVVAVKRNDHVVHSFIRDAIQHALPMSAQMHAIGLGNEWDESAWRQDTKYAQTKQTADNFMASEPIKKIVEDAKPASTWEFTDRNGNKFKLQNQHRHQMQAFALALNLRRIVALQDSGRKDQIADVIKEMDTDAQHSKQKMAWALLTRPNAPGSTEPMMKDGKIDYDVDTPIFMYIPGRIKNRRIALTARMLADQVMSDADAAYMHKVVRPYFDDVVMPMFQKAFFENTGKELDLVDNYMSTSRMVKNQRDMMAPQSIKKMMSKDFAVTDLDMLKEGKERKYSYAPYILDGLHNSMLRYTQDVARYVGYSRGINEWRSILTNPDVENEIHAKLGSEVYNSIMRKLDRIEGQYSDIDPISKIGNLTIHRVATAALMSPWVHLYQPVSFLMGYRFYDKKAMTYGLKNGMRLSNEGKKIIDELRSRPDAAILNMRKEYTRTETELNEMGTYDAATRAQSGQRTYRDMLVSELTAKPLSRMDTLAINGLLLADYHSKINDPAYKGMSREQLLDSVLHDATKNINRTQVTSSALTMSEARQSRNPFVRALVFMTGATEAMRNIFVSDFVDARNKGFIDANANRNLALSILSIFASSAVVAGMKNVRQYLLSDDEERKKLRKDAGWHMAAVFDAMAGNLPYPSATANYIASITLRAAGNKESAGRYEFKTQTSPYKSTAKTFREIPRTLETLNDLSRGYREDKNGKRYAISQSERTKLQRKILFESTDLFAILSGVGLRSYMQLMLSAKDSLKGSDQ